MTEPRAVPAPQPAKGPTKPPAAPEPLWREVLGEQLRELRRRHDETLAETAARAGISPQYLSEVERGLKEPSSEMIAAVAGALGTTLGGLAESVADELRVQREAALLLRTRPDGRRDHVMTPRRQSGPVALALAA
jgi:transcriptional regulator with XRE-family HTH domain